MCWRWNKGYQKGQHWPQCCTSLLIWLIKEQSWVDRFDTRRSQDFFGRRLRSWAVGFANSRFGNKPINNVGVLVPYFGSLPKYLSIGAAQPARLSGNRPHRPWLGHILDKRRYLRNSLRSAGRLYANIIADIDIRDASEMNESDGFDEIHPQMAVLLIFNGLFTNDGCKLLMYTCCKFSVRPWSASK